MPSRMWLVMWWLSVMTLAPPSEAQTVGYRRHVDCGSKTSLACSNAILAALETPGLTLHATTPTDTVQGNISVAFCDDRTLGEDVLLFTNGTHQVATSANIGPWLAEQGHRVLSMVGNKVTCDSLITVEVYDQDEAPKATARAHTTSFKRPLVMPTDAEIKTKLDGLP